MLFVTEPPDSQLASHQSRHYLATVCQSKVGINRIAAFSNGVLAIINTIMELELPYGSDLGTIAPLIPIFLSQILS